MVGDALGNPVEGWDFERLHATLAALLTMNRAERELVVAVLGLITGHDVLPGQARYTDDT
jgi:hypothetical protein